MDREGGADLSGSRGPWTRERIVTAIRDAGRSGDRDGADRDVGPTVRLGWVGPTGETKHLAPYPSKSPLNGP